MAIPLYGVEAHSGQIISLDDEAVVKDQASLAGAGGSAYESFVKSTVFDEGLDGGYSRIRRSVQHLHADGTATLTLTPYRDQMESGNTIQRVLAIGDNPVIVLPMSETGTNFQVKFAVTAFDAAAELGKGQQYVLPRRSSR